MMRQTPGQQFVWCLKDPHAPLSPCLARNKFKASTVPPAAEVDAKMASYVAKMVDDFMEWIRR